jgi:phage N-6-adenine-methyltransferase
MTLDPTYKKSKTVEWFTPAEVFKNLNTVFDLDPASSHKVKNVPTKKYYTKKEDGLQQQWSGFVWLNPPYSRNMDKWLKKFFQHKNGILLIFARTDTKWFHKYLVQADVLVFMKNRILFEPNGVNIKTKGRIGPSVFAGCGEKAINALKNIDGLYIDLRKI